MIESNNLFRLMRPESGPPDLLWSERQDSNLHDTDLQSGASPFRHAHKIGIGAGSRTPACGFGDRRATVTLHRQKKPLTLLVLGAC